MTTVHYAPWQRRAAAYLIDWALLIPLALVTAFATAGKVQFWCGVADVVLLVANRWLLAGWNGRTLGRTFMRIKLVGATTNKPIGVVAAFARDICHLLDTLSLCIGWIRPLWQNRHQTIADSMLQAAVVVE